MKKLTALLLVMVLMLTACGGSKLKINGANADQTKAIQKVLEDNGITVKSCKESKVEETDELTKALLELYGVYDIESKDGKSYSMSIQKSDYTVFTIADSEGNLIYGNIFGGGDASDESTEE